MSVFSFTLSRQGLAAPLSAYKGKVTLVVNTASRCSFTNANVELLNNLQHSYAKRGFTVLACPCENFAGQEPLSNGELETWRGDMSIIFPVFDKVAVKGKHTDPLFAMLQERLGRAQWNYTKFLCDRAGAPIKRFGATCPPPILNDAIEALL